MTSAKSQPMNDGMRKATVDNTMTHSNRNTCALHQKKHVRKKASPSSQPAKTTNSGNQLQQLFNDTEKTIMSYYVDTFKHVCKAMGKDWWYVYNEEQTIWEEQSNCFIANKFRDHFKQYMDSIADNHEFSDDQNEQFGKIWKDYRLMNRSF